jgi:hypothetical protein
MTRKPKKKRGPKWRPLKKKAAPQGVTLLAPPRRKDLPGQRKLFPDWIDSCGS